MSITGRLNLVNNPTVFFPPIITGGQPSGGFAPSKSTGVTVMMLAYLDLFPGLPAIPLPFVANVSAVNGDFTLPSLPAPFLSQISQVSINVMVHGRPFYRSERFPRTHTEKPLNIFVYQPVVPATDGVAAGQISAGLEGHGLPGNTMLAASPWGINVVGSQSGADVQFGIQIVPDTSANLGIFFDLAIDGWNIHVGWPADCVTSADDILNSIKTALQTAGSKANQLVSGTITKSFEGPPLKLSAAITQALLDKVSIQFVSMSLPNKHTWALSNQADKTIVVVPQLTLGFPRAF